MTSLSFALSALQPALHNALKRSSKRMYDLSVSQHRYALTTVARSADQWRPVTEDSVWLTAKPEIPRDDGKVGVLPFNIPLWSSKLGGFGLLPRRMEYPVGCDGQPLQLMAQLNFGELWPRETAPDSYPSRGVFSFYADPFDSLYGCNFDNPTEQKKFKVLFFDEELQPLESLLTEYKLGKVCKDDLEDRTKTLLWTREEQCKVFEEYCREHKDLVETAEEEWRRGLQLPSEDTADTGARLWYGVADLDSEYAVTLGDVTEVVPFRSVEMDAVLAQTIKEDPTVVNEEWMDHTEYVDVEKLLVNEDFDSYWESGVHPDLSLGGYPDFTQEDPRPGVDVSAMISALKEGKSMEEAEQIAKAPLERSGEAADYTLLLQFESGGPMMWGDFGVCNLFIKPEDLAKKRFDRVWYNWDCA